MLSKLSLFADDSKLFSSIITNKGVTNPRVIEGNRLLQEDLNKVVEWARKWKMEFNVDKCKVMHLGHNNPRGTYSMGDRQLEATEGEKDLGVFIDNKLDFGKHIRAVVGKANSILGMIRVSFACMNKTMFLNLYLALVRPLLEYCVQVWSPYKKKYIKLLEGVQRRATKLVSQIKDLSYENRLKALGLTRLVDRRVRGDMIETYKIILGKENVERENFFQMATFRGRSHSRKVYRKYSRLNIRKHWFTQRVVPKWNQLSSSEVEANKTSSFKARYDRRESARQGEMNRDNYEWG